MICDMAWVRVASKIRDRALYMEGIVSRLCRDVPIDGGIFSIQVRIRARIRVRVTLQTPPRGYNSPSEHQPPANRDNGSVSWLQTGTLRTEVRLRLIRVAGRGVDM